jgi:hypothetical protein
MPLQTDWPCWEIMKCNPDNAAQCPAYKASKPCWEVMQQFDAYSFNICRDCVVYLIKQKNSIFSQEEFLSIMRQKGIEVSGEQCPKFRSRRDQSYAEVS